MTNGNERLDRVERILERVAQSLQEVAARQQEMAAQQQGMVAQQQAMVAQQREIVARQQEMVARQQYHDEAFERHDAEMKLIREAITIDAENIRALARIAELHQRRLTDLEGGEGQAGRLPRVTLES